MVEALSEEAARRYAEARDKSLNIRKNNAVALRTVRYLGHIYLCRNKLEYTENKYKQALARYKEISALADKLCAYWQTLDMYHKHARYSYAEEMYKRAIAGYEKISGFLREVTLKALNSLAYVYLDHTKFDKAEEMQKRALAGHDKIDALEKEALKTRSDLGWTYYLRKNYNVAEEIFKRALAEYRKSGEVKSKEALNTMDRLGCSYHTEMKFEKAKAMYMGIPYRVRESWNPPR